MKHRRALFVLLCLRFADVVCGASSRNVASERQQQLEASAQAGQSTSLLAIMKKLQQRMHPAAVASEVQVDRRALSGQTTHERQLLMDMGRLEGQLESWKQAEQNLEHQVAQQAVTVESMKASEAKAIHDEQVAAVVWWDCKMLMCLLLALGLGVCIYTTNKESLLNKAASSAAEPVQQTTRKGRVQTEYIEKDAQEEAEDILVVSLPKGDIEAPTVHKETEDVWKQDFSTLNPVDETSPVSTPRSESSKCQYFNLAEEPSSQKASAEEAWWNDASGGY